MLQPLHVWQRTLGIGAAGVQVTCTSLSLLLKTTEKTEGSKF